MRVCAGVRGVGGGGRLGGKGWGGGLGGRRAGAQGSEEEPYVGAGGGALPLRRSPFGRRRVAVAFEDVLGAVAVVDVPVDDDDAPDAPPLQRVRCRHRRRVVKAKPDRLVSLGVMAGRACSHAQRREAPPRGPAEADRRGARGRFAALGAASGGEGCAADAKRSKRAPRAPRPSIPPASGRTSANAERHSPRRTASVASSTQPAATRAARSVEAW